VQDISIWLRRRLPGDDVTNLIDLDSFRRYGRWHWEKRRRRKGKVMSRQPNKRKYAHLVKVYFSIPIPFCLLLPNVPPHLFKLLFITLPLGVSLFVDTPPCLVIITFYAAVIRSFHLILVLILTITEDPDYSCDYVLLSMYQVPIPLFIPKFLHRIKQAIVFKKT